MKALVLRKAADIQVEEVAEPKLSAETDAIIRVTLSPSGSHYFRGALPDPEEGCIPGGEGVGVVEEVGSRVQGLAPGDRVIVSPVIACGLCPACQASDFDHCHTMATQDGEPALLGRQRDLPGLHAERARIPYAETNLVAVPQELTDEEAVLLPSILPKACFGIELAELRASDKLAVLGCGAVGLATIAVAAIDADRQVFAFDSDDERLSHAEALGARCYDLRSLENVETLEINRLVDTSQGTFGILAIFGAQTPAEHQQVLLNWACSLLQPGGTLALPGPYGKEAVPLPLGEWVSKNLRLHGGTCSSRRYLPYLFDLLKAEKLPLAALASRLHLSNALDDAMRSVLHSRTHEDQQLEEGLEDSFPASDPPAPAAPKAKRR